ncbi:MAG: bifunctional glutamate N-acetyltransferase/amino-acid acetyltransferase ArgJ [Ignavibacteriae bacterium]|nr:bifunctional glutamate N-acetyltransferase/amino-acid acetyltransferase ArgJ [Ignavibacteriota bacterium]
MCMFEDCKGGVTAPQGFQSAGIHCGIKKAKKDLALIYSSVPANAAAVFTTSKVQAAPILVNKLQMKRSSRCRAIIVNSGNANACTGERGLNDAWEMVNATAHALNIPEEEILVSSTGVIGQYLPLSRIQFGIPEVVKALSDEGNLAAAEAIMTTDTFSKETALRFELEGKQATIGGMAKGSGMIAPNMATMLGFLTSDVNIHPTLLQKALKQATDRSFNRISVDGDTSTNDMVTILANGLAENDEIVDESDSAYQLFYEALEVVCVKLSKMIVVDGEGATKFVEVQVQGAASEQQAVQAAKAIANSNLVKTAIHGEDANWGRILAAIGYSGIEFTPKDVEIFFGDVPILRQNYVINFSEQAAKKILMQKEIIITVDLHQGNESASFWTCDLSKEYVAINANYRT